MKLRKITADSTASPVKTTTTLYLGGSVFQNDTLELMTHEEGRIRLKTLPAGGLGWAFDYLLRDHLGNVRLVLTDEQRADAYPAATMETAQADTEEALYANLNTTRADKPSGYPPDSYTLPNDKVARVRGDGQKIGPAIVLKVMAGDKFNVRVSSWYKTNGSTPGTPVSPLTDLLSALTNSLAGASGGKVLPAELAGSGVLSPGAAGFLNTQNSYATGKPKAFLNWILFDERFQYVSSASGFEPVGIDQELKIHQLENLPLTKNGYLYVYVSNETPNLDVFFDNLQVTHVRGPLLEESHFNPFGLQMAGISTRAAGGVENRFRWNSGTELNSTFDIHLYETAFRSLDPQLGRFWQVDPRPTPAHSLYAAMANNPLLYTDPLGDTIVNGEYIQDNRFLENIVITGSKKIFGFGYSLGGWENHSPAFGQLGTLPSTTPNADKLITIGQDAREYVQQQQKKGGGWAAVTLTFLATDVAIPDPTDAAWPKWAGYAIAGGAAYLYLNGSDLTQKMSDEIDRIWQRVKGPNGYVYELRVNQAGRYIDVRGNIVDLEAGDIWKFGESTQGKRYTQPELNNMVPGGVKMNQIYWGSQAQIKVAEKYFIYGYFFNNGHLPPGNRIFR